MDLCYNNTIDAVSAIRETPVKYTLCSEMPPSIMGLGHLLGCCTDGDDDLDVGFGVGSDGLDVGGGGLSTSGHSEQLIVFLNDSAVMSV